MRQVIYLSLVPCLIIWLCFNDLGAWRSLFPEEDVGKDEEQREVVSLRGITL